MLIQRAVKGFVEDETGYIITVRERGNKEYIEGTNEGRCDLPGGRFKEGETLDQAWNREMNEEIGYVPDRGPLLDILHLFPIINGEKRWIVAEVYMGLAEKGAVFAPGLEHNLVLPVDPRRHRENRSLIGNLHSVFDKYLFVKTNFSED